MPKATEKELLKELEIINNLRTFANQPIFLLKKMPINGKMQRRFLFKLETIVKVISSKEIEVSEYTPYLPGQLLSLFLQGINNGIDTGIQIASTK